MKTSVKTVVYLFTSLHLSATFCCGVLVSNIEISPKEPLNGEDATLKCKTDDYNPSLHSWVWQKRIRPNETFVDISANERIAFLPVQQESTTSYSSTMAINRLEESDEGQYLCVVVETIGGNQNIIGNGFGEFYVNYPNEFPVCNPNGPAAVTEGDRLSCKTVIEERTPAVRLSDDPNSTRLDWILTTVGENVAGSELEKNVTIADDGLIFYCYSLVLDIRKALLCRIGPLTVTPLEVPGTTSPGSVIDLTTSPSPSPTNPSPSPTNPSPPPTTPSPLGPTTTGLPIAAIAGIGAGGFLLLLLLLFALCCGCNPKRCFRPKTYFLNFTGIFGSSPKEDDPDRDMEMDHNNPGALPSSPSGDQRMFTFEGGVEDNPAVPATEPNVYADHTVPGPSTSQFVSDPNENWHEINLKAELSQALDDEDEIY